MNASVTDELDQIPPDVYRRRWLILGVLCTSLLIIVIGNTSLNVALPSMSESLGLTNSQQQWVVDAYSLVFAGLLFTAGTLGDRFGRKGFMQTGVLLFLLGSLYATFVADSATGVIAARAVMGIGGALVMPATLSILVNCFPSHERAKAIAIWAGIAGGGGALGLVLGGWLIEHFWWGSSFAINIPVTIIALVLGALVVPSSKDRHPQKLDPIGAVLSMVGLGVFVYGLIEAPHWGWASPTSGAVIGAGVVVLALFVLWEMRTTTPMLDVGLFKNSRFTVSSLGMMLVFLTMFGFFFVVSQLFQLVLGYGPFESGLRMLPIMPLMIVAAPASAALVPRLGARVVVSGGMLLTAAGVVILSLLDAGSGYDHVLAGMFPMAIGMGLTMSPMTELIMSSVPRDRAGVGSAMNDTTRELGTTLGVAILGSILSSGYSSQLGDATSQLTPAGQDAVRGSLAGALGTAQQLAESGKTAEAQQLVDAAKEAWSHGLQLSMTIGAGIVVVAAIISARFLPGRAAPATEPDQLTDELTDGLDSLELAAAAD
ncbi:MAG: DHA2 family efflux MFS transporter permease subunit [Actinobacteria bacterium]|nr:DHA2 family efflux MFS transporter permease subunit [Actinomycetota bacterium]